LIPIGKRSGLQTRIATMESVLLCERISVWGSSRAELAGAGVGLNLGVTLGVAVAEGAGVAVHFYS